MRNIAVCIVLKGCRLTSQNHRWVGVCDRVVLGYALTNFFGCDSDRHPKWRNRKSMGDLFIERGYLGLSRSSIFKEYLPGLLSGMSQVVIATVPRAPQVTWR